MNVSNIASTVSSAGAAKGQLSSVGDAVAQRQVHDARLAQVRETAQRSQEAQQLAITDDTSTIQAATAAVNRLTSSSHYNPNQAPQYNLISGPSAINAVLNQRTAPTLSSTSDFDAEHPLGAQFINNTSQAAVDEQLDSAVASSTDHPLGTTEGYHPHEPTDASEQQRSESNPDSSSASIVQGELNLAEQQLLQQLQSRDTEVRNHERAHASVGGQYAKSPSFEYQTGSDGKRYAINGEVQIDIAEVPDDPVATINKMKQVYAAAMAPTEPSSADLRIAAQALQMMNSAQQELRQEKLDEAQSTASSDGRLGAPNINSLDIGADDAVTNIDNEQQRSPAESGVNTEYRGSLLSEDTPSATLAPNYIIPAESPQPQLNIVA